MTESGSLEATDRAATASDGTFRAVVGCYVGALLAGLATTVAAFGGAASAALAGTAAASFVGGFVVGLALASVVSALPTRLGGSFARRTATLLPSVPFAVLVVVTWFVDLGTFVDIVALYGAVAVALAGYVLSQVAQNRYVDAVAGPPDERWRWEPPSSVVMDGILLFGFVFLAAGDAVNGDWLQALLWLGVGVLWIATALAEGRWQFGSERFRSEIQCTDAGLVKRRPYTRSLVHWDEIDHVRLRGGELVLDRGLRDVRFERRELEDPDAVLEAIERRLAAKRER